MKHTPKPPVCPRPDPLGYVQHDNYWRNDTVPALNEQERFAQKILSHGNVYGMSAEDMRRCIMPRTSQHPRVVIVRREPTLLNVLDDLCHLLFGV